MSGRFPNLFSEIALGGCVIRNRIVSTGHHTYLADNAPDDRLIAYHEARARGGAGLIVSEIVAVHETAGFSRDLLKVESRDVIPAYARMVAACHGHGAKIFAQLFHPGREILSAPGGMLPVAWAPSAVPNERFHIMPKPMPGSLIRDIVEGFGRAAAILAEAGFDGFEIVASHGYLPAHFLNPRVNLRTDEYGGDAARISRSSRSPSSTSTPSSPRCAGSPRARSTSSTTPRT
jgi:2,4-dienoyl-CoA reductase-like NADH-dependent reductase (Old Yellow Enzyme family)